MCIAEILQFSEHLLCKLKYPEVILEESTDILSLDFLQRFRSMNMLTVFGCFGPDRNVETPGLFAKIRYLSKCSELKHILKAVLNMDHLVQLEVIDCKNLIYLASSSTSFRNLTTLTIVYCHGLRNVVTSSTAKSLVQLRKMDIQECRMITELVGIDERDEAKGWNCFQGIEGLVSLSFTQSHKLMLCKLHHQTPIFGKTNCEELPQEFLWRKIKQPRVTKSKATRDRRNHGRQLVKSRVCIHFLSSETERLSFFDNKFNHFCSVALSLGQ